ncbi:MAG: hypothetical protein HY782_12230 [Chloroflexi bacterium]|nr:hypothetical protein [Chloroflexota bacterium]
MTDVQQVIEIRDPEINVEETMSRIRARIRERRAQAEAKGLDYDRLAGEGLPAVGAGSLGADFYYDLHQIRTNAESIWVSLAMRDRRIPVLNPLLYRIEKLLHRLALKYVNLLAGRQVVFNRATASVMSGMAHALEQNDARAKALEKDVSALQARLAKLEQTLGNGAES